MLRFGCSETLQILRGHRRRRPQHGGAAGDGAAADLRQQLQTVGLQDHGSAGRRQQGGEVRAGQRREGRRRRGGVRRLNAADSGSSRIT